MAASHSSPRVNDLNIRHTQTQPHPHSHSRSHNHTHPQLKPEQHPPSKRRRANSANPSVTSTAEPPASVSTHWQPHLKSPSHPAESSLDSFPPRTTSPDRVSRVSNTSSQPHGGPQLRKKPKSNSIKNNNLLRAATVAIIQSPSLPTLPYLTQHEAESVQDLGSNTGNTGPSLSRANSSTSQYPSPNQKRPPASHSSYGVETTCGPPPSYSTQRTLSQERIRKLDRSNSGQRAQTSTSDQGQAPALDDTVPEPSMYKKEGVPMLIHSSPDSTDTYSIPTPTDTDTIAAVRIRGEQRTSMDEEGKASSSDERKSEDLFLNIARVDAARPPQPQTEKRRSRISIPFLPSSRQSHASKTTSVQSNYESSAVVSPRSEMPQYHSKRASLGGNISSIYSQRGHMQDVGRFREQSADLNSDNERNENANYKSGVRRASTTNTESTRLAHRSSTGLRHQRLVSESVHTEHQKMGEQIATESTISTTAPSTVWDELDDLKSRIRKLEITGKLPSSSAAAMASTERPRTATTAATTMSISPKYKQSESNLQSTIEDMPSSVHPLLYEALNNARAVLSHDVYQKLQATAQDALQLAAMMSVDGGAGSKNNSGTLSNERQIKRRTESMCRGLTELAIALAAEAKPAQPNARPPSREYSLPPNSMLRGRRYSNDLADRSHVSTRVQSRLDSRRTSLHLGRTDAGNSSPEHGVYQSPGPTPLSADVRINRSTLLRKRGQGSFDGMNDQFDASPSIRPGSRAMTDLGAYRSISKDQIQSPREYTSQHPLPTQQEQEPSTNMPLSHSVSTNFTSRRKYASPASVAGAPENGPITPRDGWGRIVTVPMDTQSPDVISEVGVAPRTSSTRRSLGFAGRIGSSVGSRLRAARADKPGRENLDMAHDRDMLPLVYHHHTTPARHSGIYSADHA